MKTIKTICAWCQATIHEGPLDTDGKASHGICKACNDKILAEGW